MCLKLPVQWQLMGVIHHLEIKTWSIWLQFVVPGVVHVPSCISLCGEILLFLDYPLRLTEPSSFHFQRSLFVQFLYSYLQISIYNHDDHRYNFLCIFLEMCFNHFLCIFHGSLTIIQRYFKIFSEIAYSLIMSVSPTIFLVALIITFNPRLPKFCLRAVLKYKRLFALLLKDFYIYVFH